MPGELFVGLASTAEDDHLAAVDEIERRARDDREGTFAVEALTRLASTGDPDAVEISARLLAAASILEVDVSGSPTLSSADLNPPLGDLLTMWQQHASTRPAAWDVDRGWIHLPAHGADMVLALARHPHASRTQRAEALRAVLRVARSAAPLLAEEDDRLGLALLALLRREHKDLGVVAADPSEVWTDAFPPHPSSPGWHPLLGARSLIRAAVTLSVIGIDIPPLGLRIDPVEPGSPVASWLSAAARATDNLGILARGEESA